MTESILTSIKKLLGLTEEDESFDEDLIMHINSVFTILNQLGVGPNEIYSIDNTEDTWTEFTNNGIEMKMVRSYMYMKVKLMFDPPSNSFTVKSMEAQVQEYEWRLKTMAEEISE